MKKEQSRKPEAEEQKRYEKPLIIGEYRFDEVEMGSCHVNKPDDPADTTWLTTW
mgnify:CR=1 FL=1